MNQSKPLNVRPIVGVLDEVLKERMRQELKWGQQNHPSFTAPPSFSMTPRFLQGYYGVMDAETAKALCESAFVEGFGSYAHILYEELCEAFDEPDDEQRLRAELLQVAAVAAAWVEAIDRRDPYAELRRLERLGYLIQGNHGTLEVPAWHDCASPAKFSCPPELYRAVWRVGAIDANVDPATVATVRHDVDGARLEENGAVAALGSATR